MSTWAADQIAVSLESGREFTGYVDPRTDQQRLWLRSEASGIQVVRPIVWKRITGAKLADRPLSVELLKQSIDRLKAPAAARPIQLLSLQPHSARAPSAARSHPETTAGRPAHPTVRIRSVDFDAEIANWDGDVEPDGLLIHVYPMDERLEMTGVSGSLSVELFAPRHRDYHWVPHGRGQSIGLIGRWSRMIRPADLTPRGIVIKLPFQATHPSFDAVGTYGLVHLRLAVPGHGVFEDSLDGVRTRRVFTPNRDALLRQHSITGRYLPTERTGRAKRTRGY